MRLVVQPRYSTPHGGAGRKNSLPKRERHIEKWKRRGLDSRDVETPSVARPVVGNMYLVTVAVLWGSYTPAVRTLFTFPEGPTPLTVAALRGALQAGLLGLALLYQERERLSGLFMEKEGGATALAPIVLGGVEIGLYNTIGTLCQTWGLSVTSATRGAFLVQATALWTPILSSCFGIIPSPQLWLSSFIALLSTLLVTLDKAEGAASDLYSEASVGDIVTLIGALCYSMATVRIPMYSTKVLPLRLAFAKSLVLAVISIGALLSQGADTKEMWPGISHQPLAWALLAWTAIGPGALSAYLHVKGQSMVSPTDAQIVFATVPLWSALIAALTLPNEQVGLLTWIGGGGMLMAGLVGGLAIPSKTK